MPVGIHRILSLTQPRIYGRSDTSSRVGKRSPQTRSSSSWAILTTSGNRTIAWMTEVRVRIPRYSNVLNTYSQLVLRRSCQIPPPVVSHWYKRRVYQRNALHLEREVYRRRYTA